MRGPPNRYDPLRIGLPMQKALAFVENNLLLLAVVTAALGLLVPSLGMVLESGISPLLALLMLVISLTFDAHAVKLLSLIHI